MTGQNQTMSAATLATYMGMAALLTFMIFGLQGCEKKPPAMRAAAPLTEITTANSQRGGQLFKEHCQKCHKQPGSRAKGPHLVNVYGAKAALLTDFKYSEAMRTSNLTWDEATLDAYIANPKKALPQTRMLMDGIAKAQDRADIIAYISTLHQ